MILLQVFHEAALDFLKIPQFTHQQKKKKTAALFPGIDNNQHLEKYLCCFPSSASGSLQSPNICRLYKLKALIANEWIC